MTDIELLKYAAKAAGIKVDLIKYKNTAVCEADDNYEELPQDRWYFVLKNTPIVWNPLTDDGDAFRLLIKLGFAVHYPSNNFEVGIGGVGGDFYEKHDCSPYAATRKAIVRAAAEIGKNMK